MAIVLAIASVFSWRQDPKRYTLVDRIKEIDFVPNTDNITREKQARYLNVWKAGYVHAIVK